MTKEDIARICHEANRGLCDSQGDYSQSNWNAAPDWQRRSAIQGVQFHLDNPNAPPSASHESWLAEKERDGWAVGPVKDAGKKQHPCMVPFERLPPEQQAKDYLFTAIVNSMAPFLSKVRDESPKPVTAMHQV